MIYDPEQFDVSPTREIVSDVVGEQTLRDFEAAHKPTFDHQLRVGELTRRALADQDFSPEVQFDGSLSGGLHDTGKFLSPEIQRLIDSPRALTTEEQAIVAQHSALGSACITSMASAYSVYGRQLQTAAFVAENHHNRQLLTAFDDGSSYEEGLTRVVSAFDVLDALRDPARAYVRSREQNLTPKRILAIVMSVIGGNEPKLPQGESFAGVSIAAAIQNHLMLGTLDT